MVFTILPAVAEAELERTYLHQAAEALAQCVYR
jgi:hypothetical protein